MHSKHKEIIKLMQQGWPLIDVINSPEYYIRQYGKTNISISEDVYYTMRELEYIEPDRSETNNKGKIIAHILRLTTKYRQSV